MSSRHHARKLPIPRFSFRTSQKTLRLRKNTRTTFQILAGQNRNPQRGQQLFGGASAWRRLPEFASEIADGISDSESVVSIGELGDDTRLDVDRDNRAVPDENLNNWEVRIRNDRRTVVTH